MTDAEAKQVAWEAWREKARQHGEPEEGLGAEFDAWWYELRHRRKRVKP